MVGSGQPLEREGGNFVRLRLDAGGLHGLPRHYSKRKEIMFQDIDIVRRLWRGERVPMPGPLGKDVQVRVFPRPVQKELPLWLTAAGNAETFQMAAGSNEPPDPPPWPKY